MEACDICVIGAGSGGLSVAAGAAQLGRKTILIEKAEMGGDCLNAGCIPSKALIAAAARAQMMREASAFGIDAEAKIDSTRVHLHVRGIIDAIAPNDSQDRFEKLGVTVIRAPARFLDGRTLEAGGRQIRARRFVIATGSRPVVPPIPGLADVAYFTNETVFDIDFIPLHLAIIGGGPVGLELAQAHRRLGAKVSVIEMGRILPHEDEAAAAVVRQALVREGVRILENAHATAIRKTESGIAMQIVTAHGSEVIAPSHILVAAGRKPNIEDLNLQAAGVAAGANGIEIDRSLKTSNARIYAIGDVTPAPRFTHVANYHAGLVIRHALFRMPVRADYTAIARITFTDPELAQVGLTEEEARHTRVTVARADFAQNDRAVIERAAEGFAKLVLDPKGRIVGATIVGAHAGELIQPWAMAIGRRIKLSAMAAMTVAYPSLSEISKRAAGAHFAPLVFGRRARLLARLLALFG